MCYNVFIIRGLLLINLLLSQDNINMFNSKCCGHGGGMCMMGMIAKVLLVVGGLNWGVYGVGMLMGNDWNAVSMLLGSMPMVEGVVYVLVGLVAVMEIFGGCRCAKCTGGACATCSSKGEGQM